jgi:hypothetical protein
MKRIFITTDKVAELKKADLIATQNLASYNPYYYDNGKYIIDIKWFSELPLFSRELISIPIPTANLVFADILVPHNHKKTFKINCIYQAFTYSYDYDYWYSSMIPNGPQGVIILPLSLEEKECMREITERRLEKKEPYQENAMLLVIRKRIEDNTSKNQNYFIKLSGTSSKKDENVIPLKKSRSIMDYLTRSFAFLSQEYSHPNKKTSIIFIPWLEINSRSEFRVFINGKVTAIGQQRWSRDYSYTDEEVDIIETSILKSNFWIGVPYASFVADVFVDFSKKQATLIECNPFGSFSPSESSLFSWSIDRAVLYGEKQKEIRLVRNT